MDCCETEEENEEFNIKLKSVCLPANYARDNFLSRIYVPEALAAFGTFLWNCGGPRGKAAAVYAKNVPPARFLHAATVLQEIIYIVFSIPETIGFRDFSAF